MMPRCIEVDRDYLQKLEHNDLTLNMLFNQLKTDLELYKVSLKRAEENGLTAGSLRFHARVAYLSGIIKDYQNEIK